LRSVEFWLLAFIPVRKELLKETSLSLRDILSWIIRKNEDILQELNTTSVLEKITKYRHNWVKYVRRMNNSRFPKALIDYHPCGRRRPGRHLKRLLDGVQIETETGHMGLIS
jgi:hypothetical protein